MTRSIFISAIKISCFTMLLMLMNPGCLSRQVANGDPESMNGHEDSPEKRKEIAEELLVIMQWHDMSREVIKIMEDYIFQQIDRLDFPPEAEDEVRKVQDETILFLREMDWTQIEKMIVDFYAEYFSTSELHKLIDFYGSKTGRKSLELSPILMESSMQVANQMVMERIPQLEQRLMMEMEEIYQKYEEEEEENDKEEEAVDGDAVDEGESSD